MAFGHYSGLARVKRLRGHNMAKIFVRILRLVIPAMASVAAAAQSTPAPSRGQLLYTTHCVACHNSQMHWRDKRQAADWPGLKVQVRQWQASIGLQWSEATSWRSRAT